ncbi:MAG: glycosyltransferase, partial [Pseudomonadota bacterium]
VNSAAGPHMGGAERMARTLHRGILAAGGESRLIALSGPAPDCPHAISLFPENPSKSPYGGGVLMALRRHLRRTVRPGDVVHGHLFPTLFYLAALRRMGALAAPLVYTEHNTQNRRRTLLGGRTLDAALYGAVDGVVAISEGVRDALLAWCPSLAGRTHVIANGVPLPPPAPDRRGPVRHVVSVGHLTPQKNYGAAIEAMAAVMAQNPLAHTIHYTIAGEGSERARLARLIAQKGLQNRIRLLGAVSDPAPLYGAADVFFMPSLFEGFGLAAVEAMAAGLPVISADVPGLREVVPDGAGIRTAPHAAAMAEALTQMAALPAGTRIAMGKVGAAQAARFGEDAMICAHRRLYGRFHKAALAARRSSPQQPSETALGGL